MKAHRLQQFISRVTCVCFHPTRAWRTRRLRLRSDRAKPNLYYGNWQLALRHWLPFSLRYPIVVTTRRERIRLYLSRDPIDEKVARNVAVAYRTSYFPPVPVVLPARPTILDLGAHHGFYTVYALALYPAARLICVEPNRAAIPLLKRNLALNHWLDRARIIHAGLAATATTGCLRLSTEGSWGDSFFEQPDKTLTVQEVPMLTLAEILQEARPDIVKCNAEGAEFEFVRQLLAMPWRPALLSIAVHEEWGDSQTLLTAMQQAGYQMMQTGEAHRPTFHFWRL